MAFIGEAVPSNCLICFANAPRKSSRKESYCEGLSLVDKQLNVVFILRNLLEVPPERLEAYLTCVGSPDCWGVWVCGKCQVSVREAVKIHESLVKAQGKLKGVKEKLIGNIRESNKCTKRSGGGGSGRVDWITDQSRTYALTHNYGNFKNPFISGDIRARQMIFGDEEFIEESSTPVLDSDPLSEEVKVEISQLLIEPADLDEDSSHNFSVDWNDEDESMESTKDGTEEDESDFDEEKARNGEGVYFKPSTIPHKPKCIRCGVVCSSIEDFLVHLKLHKSSPHHCVGCKRVYRDDRSLQLHVSKYHPTLYKYKRGIKKSRKLNNMKREVKKPSPIKIKRVPKIVVVPSQPVQRPVSGPDSTFEEASEIKDGVDYTMYYTRQREEAWKCLRCGIYGYKSLKDVLAHLHLHLTSPFRCDKCKRVYPSTKTLRNHQMKYHPEFRVSELAKKIKLAKQRKLHSSSSKSEHDGDTYESQVSSKMDDKEVAKNGEAYNKCEMCKRVYPSVRILRGHQMQCHPEFRISEFSKKIKLAKRQLLASATATTSNSEINHELAVNGKAYRKCELCDVLMPEKRTEEHVKLWHEDVDMSSLEKNEDTMGTETEYILPEPEVMDVSGVLTRYSCPKCKKKLISLEKFKHHLELHKESPFHCYICRMVFSSRKRMTDHVCKCRRKEFGKPEKNSKMVTKSGKIRCAKCLLLIQPHEIDKHLQLHETSPYNCQVCLLVFTTELFLTKHMRRCHFKEFDKMRRINPVDPIRVNLEEDVLTEEGNASEVKCPGCLHSVNQERVHLMCEHLENCGERSSNLLPCPLPYCNFEAKEIIEFGEHVLNCREDHQNPNLVRRIFQCGLCPRRHFVLEDFIEHYQDHAVNTSQCTQCSRRFPSPQLEHYGDFHPHLRRTIPVQDRYTLITDLPDIHWWCMYCNTRFSDEEERDSHVQSSHPQDNLELHVCPTCSKGYTCPDDLRLHEGTAHIAENLRLEKTISCDICKYFCTTQKHLEDHKRKVHRMNLFMCDVCGQECNSESNLKQHRQLHQPSRDIKCDECSETFTTNRYLRDHKFRAHTPHDERNPLVCKYCSKVFKCGFYLRNHIATIHEFKFKVICHLCGYGAMSKSRVKKHMALKHKIGERKKWPCQIEGCGRLLDTPVRLREHLDRHNGTPRFSCQFCDKKFYENSRKRRHEQIHTNAEVKPYVCHICSKGFPVRNYLYIHMKSHRNK